MRRIPRWILSWSLLLCAAVQAQDANIVRTVADLDARLASMPFEIVKAEKARGIALDVALKTEAKFEDGVELRIKLRPANPEASEFNNEPRYEMAAYVLQKAFLDEPDHVVPPTALRALPRAMLKPYAPAIQPTFRVSDEVIVVVQYWLKQVSGPKDIWDPARFERDPVYARHIGNLNVLTYLIKHGDSNAGNLLISTAPGSPRAFAVDSGVAFAAPESNRGNLWAKMRVPRVPRQTIDRVRALDADRLEALLGAVASWEYKDRKLTPKADQPRIGASAARRNKTLVQLGLTRREILDVDKRRAQLLAMVDEGKLGTF